jgi:hypothetical protein
MQRNLKILKYLILATFTLTARVTPVFANDAFGLDRFKSSVEAITKPKTPYLTRFGNQIKLYNIKNPTDSQTVPARFLVQGGLHGNELLGSEFVAWLAQRFATGESILTGLNHGNVEIDFIPYANPDGTIQFTRYNGNKINLNRNFGVLWGVTKENPGKGAFSEVETRAVRDLLNTRNYTGAVDVHGYINWVVIPTSPEDAIKGLPTTKASVLKQYNRWANFIKKETAARLPGYEVHSAGGLGDGGAFEDYAWWGAGVPAACLELFSSDRYIPKTIANKIVDLLTPKFLEVGNSIAQNSDMFIVYESYLYSLFNEALKIKSDRDDTPQMASSSTR